MVNKSNLQWRVYKPNNQNKGAASRIEFRVEEKIETAKDGKTFKNREGLLFWVSAPQTGKDSNDNATFAWGDKTSEEVITVKMGEPDVGDILAVLGGLKQAVGPSGKGLFHQTAKGNKSFTFEHVKDNGYKIRVSSKEGDKLRAVSHTISYAEGKVLEILLQESVRLTYNWG